MIAPEIDRCGHCKRERGLFAFRGAWVNRITHEVGCPGTTLDHILYGDFFEATIDKAATNVAAAPWVHETDPASHTAQLVKANAAIGELLELLDRKDRQITYLNGQVALMGKNHRVSCTCDGCEP